MLKPFLKILSFSDQLWNVHSYSPVKSPLLHHWRTFLEFGPLKVMPLAWYRAMGCCSAPPGSSVWLRKTLVLYYCYRQNHGNTFFLFPNAELWPLFQFAKTKKDGRRALCYMVYMSEPPLLVTTQPKGTWPHLFFFFFCCVVPGGTQIVFLHKHIRIL